MGVCWALSWVSVGPFHGCLLGPFVDVCWAFSCLSALRACGHHDAIWCACAGSIAFAMLPDGRSARAAGCGAAFLDGGCGYDLGTNTLALRAAMTA